MRLESDQRSANAPVNSLSAFYREEFIKHRECLELQRDVYSELAISGFEEALRLILRQLDELCAKKDVDLVVGRLLRKFDALTGLSAYTTWSDHPAQFH
jgi:hypothetical protein